MFTKKYRANTWEARDAENHPAAIKARAALLEEFGKKSLSGIYLKKPPIRGPFGSANICIKEDAVLVAKHPYRQGGERREAWAELSNKARKEKTLERSTGAWNLPTIPVAKKTPGKYPPVKNLRPLNDATIKYDHPLSGIVDMVHNQSKEVVVHIWPLEWFPTNANEAGAPPNYLHVYPKGTMQWNVLVRDMKNASEQFQRMM